MIGDRIANAPSRPVPPPKHKDMNQEIAQSLAKQVIALMNKDELTMDDFFKASAILHGALMLLESTN